MVNENQSLTFSFEFCKTGHHHAEEEEGLLMQTGMLFTFLVFINYVPLFIVFDLFCQTCNC